MARSFDTRQFDELVRALTQPGAVAELGVLAVCLTAAWIVVRLIRGRYQPVGSVWFGERIIDGVLFPVLALGFAFAASIVLSGTIRPAVFRVAIPILVSLVVIRLIVRVLTRTYPDVGWVRTVERSVSWLAWLAVALWVTGVLPSMLEAMDDVSWKFGASRMSLRTIVEGIVSVGIVIVLALWLSAAIERRLLRGSGNDLSLRKIAATLLRAALLLVGLLLALSAVGIDLTTLSVLGGAIGVGIGFGLQKIAANYVSGFVILAERSLRIGDMVKVDTFEGRITDIRTRYTLIRSLNGRDAIVPNESLITQRIENLSLADRRVLVQSRIRIAYGSDVRVVQTRLEAAVAAVPRVLADPGPSVQLDAFGADGIELTVNFWIGDPENGQGNVKSDVNLAVLEALNAAGIEIPLPQQVVQTRRMPTVDADADADADAPAPPLPAR